MTCPLCLAPWSTSEQLQKKPQTKEWRLKVEADAMQFNWTVHEGLPHQELEKNCVFS